MRRQDREVTNLNEISDIIDSCKVLTLAMVDGECPYVVPLNFGYSFVGETLTLYFHCAKQGRKLDILEKNSNVSFSMHCDCGLIDAEVPCNTGFFYKSVIGSGKAEFVETAEQKCEALAILMQAQTGRAVAFTNEQANKVCVFKVVATDFSAKSRAKP